MDKGAEQNGIFIDALRSGRRFDGVYDHNDTAYFRTRPRAFISEQVAVHFFVRHSDGLIQKVTDRLISVVFLRDLRERLGKTLFSDKVRPLFRMARNKRDADFGNIIIVRVISRLIFGKANGIIQFANVVVASTGFCQRSVFSDRLRAVLRQSRHGDGVIIGAGSLFCQSLHKRRVGRTYFFQPEITVQAESHLEKRRKHHKESKAAEDGDGSENTADHGALYVRVHPQ